PIIVSHSNQSIIRIDEQTIFEITVKDIVTPEAELIDNWSIDGEPIDDATESTLAFCPSNTGRINVIVTVNNDKFPASHEWIIDVIDPDTDGDGLTDSIEDLIGTAPLLTDTDADGLSDNEELKNGTTPLIADSDVDGLSDYEELKLGTNPV